MTRALFFLGLGLLLFFAPDGLTLAEPPQTARQAIAAAKQGDEDVGVVHAARSLLGQTVKNGEGDTFGKIEDIGIDLGTGKVAAVFVMPAKELPGERQSLNIPITALSWTTTQGSIVLSMPPLKATNPPEAAPPIKQPTEVLLIAKLPEIPVNDARGKKLGSIVDFAIGREKGWVAYAVVALDQPSEQADRRYPIPLPSFVVPDASQPWILELRQGVLEGTPSFAKDAWPNKVSPAWSEYVHVRYGRSALGGVERKARSPSTIQK